MLHENENEFWMHPSAQHRYRLFAYEHKIKGYGAPGNRTYINGNITVQ